MPVGPDASARGFPPLKVRSWGWPRFATRFWAKAGRESKIKSGQLGFAVQANLRFGILAPVRHDDRIYVYIVVVTIPLSALTVELA